MSSAVDEAMCILRSGSLDESASRRWVLVCPGVSVIWVSFGLDCVILPRSQSNNSMYVVRLVYKAFLYLSLPKDQAAECQAT